MKIIFTEPFKKDYEGLPLSIQQMLDKALQFLLQNPRHPSLQTRKLPGTKIWYGRVSRAYRFTFEQNQNYILLRRIGVHKILNHERKTK